jgi:hypothetical protein
VARDRPPGQKKAGDPLKASRQEKLQIEETRGGRPGVYGQVCEWPFRLRHDGEAGGYGKITYGEEL